RAYLEVGVMTSEADEHRLKKRELVGQIVDGAGRGCRRDPLDRSALAGTAGLRRTACGRPHYDESRQQRHNIGATHTSKTVSHLPPRSLAPQGRTAAFWRRRPLQCGGPAELSFSLRFLSAPDVPRCDKLCASQPIRRKIALLDR